MYIDLRVKYPLLLSDFNETSIFSTDFQKNTQISNFMKILPVGAELFHADGRTDMNLIIAFRNFTKAPKQKGRPDELFDASLQNVTNKTLSVKQCVCMRAYVCVFVCVMP